jgi:TDG/mug DNA glycosylase family protein
MDRATIDSYEREAGRWVAARGSPKRVDEAIALVSRVGAGEWRADLGCGPGWHSPALGIGGPVVALDATQAMAAHTVGNAPEAHAVVGDLEALPLRTSCLGAAWAQASYQHLPMDRVPLALADLHRVVRVGAPAIIRVTSDRRDGSDWSDPFGARHFSYWPIERLRGALVGGGFTVESIDDDGVDWLTARVRRERTLADVVGAGMQLLIVGLNPSIYSADLGVGFARPGNRFWPALLAAGLATRDRDPLHTLRNHGVGFTDLVKRATARADELDPSEYVAGAERGRDLVEWLQPAAVCFAGLSGYRVAVDRRAVVGWQRERFGGVPTYVMPNPSGINAHTNIADLVAHLRAATSHT